MEVKKESEHFFIEEQKVDIEEHIFPNVIVDANIIQVCNIKTESVPIKQENDVDYLEQTCDDVKNEIKEIIDGEDRKCKLVRINETKKLGKV